ncbi:uncharacterized protein LOC112493417 [Ziziphus jujuba]|uniref:Uncharacterized protein LOC112493417 n=2 Tax=Ziziphus jujuba TaxID=326968 RepID=A0A6P6GME4_ZIZJJ|nr:uncharacterized protein LOC112493417 [Ziziphus jujuba]KAH7513763.1 hypothetical protein FEM48_Zijuj11G0016000 [Ziziphus jujuba var. spinosa]
MAKLYLTVAVIFLIFAFSNARTPADLPATEVIGDESLNTQTRSDIQTASNNPILLPSERSDNEPVTLVELEPDTIRSNFAEFRTGESSPKDSEPTSESVPLTVISFRPINRHFPRRPFPLSFRHGHRCRHGHSQFKPWGPRPLRREVSYGNDMIIDGEEAKSFKPVFRDEEEPQIRTRMIRFRQGPRFPFRHDEEDQMERPNDHEHEHDRDHHHHLHVFHRHHMDVGRGQPKEREAEKEQHNPVESFMKSFRKFLNRF